MALTEAQREYQRQYYLRNAEKRKQQQREWHAKNKDKRKAYIQANSEHIRERSKVYRADHAEHYKELRRNWHTSNRDEQLAKHREYCQEHRDELRAKALQKYHQNPEKWRAYFLVKYWENVDRNRERMARWMREHPEYRKNSKYKRRAMLIEAGSFTTEEWQALVEVTGHICLRCKRSELEVGLTVDHIIPLSKGGANTIENIQPLCAACNTSKGVRSTDYRPVTLRQS